MNTADYVRAFRRGAWLIILVTAAFTGIAVVSAIQSSDRFRSDAELLLAPVSSPNVNDVYTSQQIIQRNLATFAALVTSPEVLEPSADELGVPSSELASQVVATFTSPEALITVSATDSAPQSAQEIARVISEQAVQVLNAPPADDGARVVNASVIVPAGLPTDSEGAPGSIIVAGGFVTGLLLGLALALLRIKLDGTVRTAADATSALGLPTFGALPKDFSPDREQARDAALMAASSLSRGWLDEPHRLLIAGADDRVDPGQLAEGLKYGFERLGIPTAIVRVEKMPSPATAGAPSRTHPAENAILASLRSVDAMVSRATSGGARVILIPAPAVPNGPAALLLSERATECVMALRSGQSTESNAREALRILNAAGLEVRGLLLATDT